MEQKYEYFKKALDKKREQKEYSQLRCVVPVDENHIISKKEKIINFSSNDFLGLSLHPHVKKNTIKSVLEWGAGSSPSRLLTGHLECHKQIEERLAELLGKESSLLFSSSYKAHQTIFTSIANNRSLIFIDRFSHQGLIQAATLSQGKVLRYEHSNIAQLKTLLQKYKTTPCSSKLIISESLFGLNGKICDIESLIELAKEHQALLYLDDSYAMGTQGRNGMGLGSYQDEVDIVTGFFGKGCGSFGAYVATNKLLQEYMITFSSQFMETNALPPAALGAINASLDLIPSMEIERNKIEEKSNWLREELKNNHWNTGYGTSHIIPIICSTEQEYEELSQALFHANILATPLRPPAVPQGLSRILLIVNALHTEEELQQLVATVNSLKKEYSLS